MSKNFSNNFLKQIFNNILITKLVLMQERKFATFKHQRNKWKDKMCHGLDLLNQC